MSSIFVKSIAIIDSCKTIEQLKVAKNFLQLSSRNMSYHTEYLLMDRYISKINEIKSEIPIKI